MTINRRAAGLVASVWGVVFFCGASLRLLADCADFGLPFTDLGSETQFCAAIAEAYYTGITNGTSATTFSPNDNMTRAQAAAFATRTLDAGLARGSRRAALGQWWTTTPHFDSRLGVTAVGDFPELLSSDGADVWVANYSGTVTRTRGSDGRVIETWTGATHAYGVLAAMGRIFVTGYDTGKIYMIDPTQPATDVAVVVSNIQSSLRTMVFDGSRIWVLGDLNTWIVDPSTWQVTAGPGNDFPAGIGFDGTHVWLTDADPGSLNEFDTSGVSIASLTLGLQPKDPVFDGANLWVPINQEDSVSVVSARTRAVLKTFSSANGVFLDHPIHAAFDGERILVTNVGHGSAVGFISLFRASDLSFIGNVATPGVGTPFGVCSDGVNFWITFTGTGNLGRF